MKRFTFAVIDFLVIIMQTTISMSVVPYVLLGKLQSSKFLILYIAFITIVAYLVRFRKLVLNFSFIKFLPFTLLTLGFVFQAISCILQGNINGLGATFFTFIDFLFFAMYLCGIYHESMGKIVKPYIAFCSYNCLVVVLSLSLISLGIINEYTNNIGGLAPALFSDNVSSGQEYYMPMWLSIESSVSERLLHCGVLCGLFHEPHVFCYYVTPGFFILLGTVKSFRLRLFAVIMFTVSIIASFSVTFFIALSVCLVVKSLFSLKNKQYTSFFLILACFIIFIIYKDFFNSYLTIKFEGSGSLDFTTARLSSVLVPHSLFGDGILMMSNNTNIPYSMRNAGLFAAAVYVIFYLSMFFESVKLIATTNKTVSFFGLAFLYFLIHGIKLTYAVFAMPYTLFMVILLWMVKSSLKRDSFELIKPV